MILYNIYMVIPVAFLAYNIPNIYQKIITLDFDFMCFKCISFWIALLYTQDIFIAGWCAIIATILDSLMDVRL